MGGKTSCSSLLHKHTGYSDTYMLNNFYLIPIVLIAPETIMKPMIVSLKELVIYVITFMEKIIKNQSIDLSLSKKRKF